MNNISKEKDKIINYKLQCIVWEINPNIWMIPAC